MERRKRPATGKAAALRQPRPVTMYHAQNQDRSEDRSPERPDQPTEGSIEPENTRVRSSTLLAPFAISVGYVGAAIAIGPALFDTGMPGRSRVVSFVLLGLLLHVAGYATSRLYTDARRITELDAGWRPNPWHYICGGALALLGLRVAETTVTGRPVSSPAIYFLGNAFAALPLSSIVAGPVYWANRRRRCESQT